MTSLPIVRELLATLIAFDTTSRYSNLDLIDWVEDRLSAAGAVCERIPNESGDKANLWARIGPDVPGGLVLSGHTDVVPVDGQDWHTDPFKMTELDGRLYGRGTSDMKGFIALCLAFAPEFAKLDLERPIHFAFSYDEEIGCQGAPAMIHRIVERGAAPRAVWVGEPTLWRVVSGHKGIILTEVEVIGHEAHSSLSHLGISAIGEAVDIMATLRAIEADLIANAPDDSPFFPPHPTLSIGEISGGTATNILARRCRFAFDLRCPPGYDPEAILAPFHETVKAVDQRIRARFPESGVRVRRLANAPPMTVDLESPAEILVRALTGDNALSAVAYATEAGQFQQAGISSIICGPGSIDQAHIPNEWIDIEELEKGVDIFTRLVEHLEA